jgi:multiple sugar transport system permease protein
MTGGGPGAPGRTDVIAHRIFSLAFEDLDLGKASALSVVLMVGLIVVTVLQQVYFRRRITYEVAG